MSDEYFEGRFAFWHGFGEDENPYECAGQCCGEQQQYDDWQSGWYDAEAGQ
jgi:hypothetical protein